MVRRLSIALAGVVLASAAPGCERERPDIVIPDEPGAPRPAVRPVQREPARDASVAALPSRPVRGPGYEGYVRQGRGPGQWQPADADIAALEAELPASAREAAARGDIPAAVDLATYTRRYVGWVSDGVPIVEVTLLCPRAAHLAERDMSIRGGGSCLVSTAYDTRDRRFLYWRTREPR